MTTFGAVTPQLPARDLAASIAFYRDRLGFEAVHLDTDIAILRRDGASVMLFPCTEPKIAEWTAIRIAVTGIEAFYATCTGVVHPNAPLATKPWGTREFAVIDPAGVCITFHE